MTSTPSSRHCKEAIKAEYAAAGVITGAGLAFGGMSEEMGDVGLATRRAEDKVAQVQARASALDEMLGSGRLEVVTAPAGSEKIQAQLDEVSTQDAVDAELARVKQRLACAQEQDGST
jgi:phage shock protein A